MPCTCSIQNNHAWKMCGHLWSTSMGLVNVNMESKTKAMIIGHGYTRNILTLIAWKQVLCHCTLIMFTVPNMWAELSWIMDMSIQCMMETEFGSTIFVQKKNKIKKDSFFHKQKCTGFSFCKVIIFIYYEWQRIEYFPGSIYPPVGIIQIVYWTGQVIYLCIWGAAIMYWCDTIKGLSLKASMLPSGKTDLYCNYFRISCCLFLLTSIN